ncbi:MAG: hypothetical protein SGJ27_31185 [Candidatus Melainabacteria bacterium]|nr:hypothetical protein [Candidatus Melainabacteria bacterium]
MKEADRLQLKRILCAVDENFLVALANKGLVRRAQKDLEGVTLQIEEADDAIVVRGADWTVWMPVGGPAKAKDDTVASGITRQILSATIYLRDHWSGDFSSAPVAVPDSSQSSSLEAVSKSATSAVPTVQSASEGERIDEDAEKLKDALLSISVDELSKWAGKQLVGDLLSLLDETVEVEIECRVGVIIRIPQHDVEIRLLPTADRGLKLLDQLLSTAPKAMHKRWIATALLVLHRKSGKELQRSSSQKATVESPRNQLQILQECENLLASMLDSGVSHPSSRVVERLFTLSISTSIVQLPRLSHLLKTLSDEVSHLLTRHAKANTHRLFSTMSWTYTLVKALEKHAIENRHSDSRMIDFPLELAGVARTQYDLVGDLELCGMGAHQWQTASGYEGMTVLFWDRTNKRILTWSMSRPGSTISKTDIEHAYDFESTWSGRSPSELSRSTFVLKNARVNPFGRLSGGQQTTIEGIAKSSFTASDFEGRVFSNWRAVRNYAAKQFPVGLKTHKPLDRIVVLEPKSWNDRFYDEMHQRFCWDLVDGSGDSLRLTLPWSDSNVRAIEFLEALKPGVEKINRVVARIGFSTNGLLFEPLAMLSTGTTRGGAVLNPSFDHELIEAKQSPLLLRLRQKFGRNKIATTMTDDDDWTELQNHFDISKNVPPHLLNVISETEGILLQVAESGTQRLNEKTSTRFKELGEKLSHSGLVVLRQSVSAVAARSSPAQSVLWSDYLCSLHKQALSLAAMDR